MGTFRGWDLGGKIQQSKMMTSGLGGKLKNWWSGPSQGRVGEGERKRPSAP